MLVGYLGTPTQFLFGRRMLFGVWESNHHFTQKELHGSLQASSIPEDRVAAKEFHINKYHVSDIE